MSLLKTRPVEGLVLAAGLSSRMGTSKLELQIQGISVIARVVEAALNSDLGRVVLVAGLSPQGVTGGLGPMAKHGKLFTTVNSEPGLGMSRSLIVGLDAISPDVEGAMIILGDQPMVTSEVINKLLGTFDANPNSIVVPLVHHRRTHPLILPADLLQELREIRGDVGGRSILKRHADRMVTLEMGHFYDDIDLDTPEDVRLMIQRMNAGQRSEQ